jgi:apolipoprotein N-acyltransferase
MEAMLDSPAARFSKHYVEMVLVMLAGMFVLGGAVLLPLLAAGVTLDELRADAPALILLGMGLSMAAPMVWWMERRGHSRPANVAMAASMLVPAAALVLLLATGAQTDLESLLMLEHTVMFPAMLVAMLPYRAEFIHAHA